MKFFALHLRGGTDLACAGCVGDAKFECGRALMSVGEIECPGEECVWCGVQYRDEPPGDGPIPGAPGDLPRDLQDVRDAGRPGL